MFTGISIESPIYKSILSVILIVSVSIVSSVSSVPRVPLVSRVPLVPLVPLVPYGALISLDCVHSISNICSQNVLINKKLTKGRIEVYLHHIVKYEQQSAALG